MKTSEVFTDLTAIQLHAKITEYNGANVSEGTNWNVKHLFSTFYQRQDANGYWDDYEYYTLVLERD